MKEQIAKIKETGKDLKEAVDEFKKKRQLFNLTVEDVCEEKGYTEFDLNYENSEIDFSLMDSYARAKCFFEEYGFFCDNFDRIKETNPKYGRKRLLNLYIETLKGFSLIEEEKAIQIASNYLLYEKCNFKKILESENKALAESEKVEASVNDIISESAECITKAGQNIANVFKPYGEVAKGQLTELGQTSKKFINGGSKKLVKVFSKIAAKTEDDNKED